MKMISFRKNENICKNREFVLNFYYYTKMNYMKYDWMMGNFL